MTKKYAIVMPCYNESTVIARFLDDIEVNLSDSDCEFLIIVVDDASNDSTAEILKRYRFKSEKLNLRAIRLKFNMGHQEAIRQGLVFVKSLDEKINGLIVMDSDGEDDPKAILELIKFKMFDVVFVERKKRKDNIGFKLGYFFYRLLFRIVTGKKITFGNYSLISPDVFNAVVNQKFFHYAGFISKQKFKIQKIQFDRLKRLDGESKMNYNNLVIHGLKSLIEYAEELLIFFLKGFVLVSLFSLMFGFIVLYKKIISHVAILGWASSVGIGLVVVCLIIVSTIILSLLLLSIKNTLRQNEISFDEIKN